MAIDRLVEEIRKLSPADRLKLRIILETEDISKEDVEVSRQTAGKWDDIDADKLVKDIYNSRQYDPGRAEVNW
ncbi:hypothetical protein [Desulfotomaculum copahuensis]|uniref:Uncharacterized protein n=1 Tax=Desulfotomaculum copahuensis TaxID=1838280 RepID=A0A1B7LD18_9FIRM|nr:hypothetical protein [Desulfotomaculum copahuensis]OAT80826.1 hypothetical protein A6M21_12610 [Desulfotomaculum copahuensis]